MPGTPYVPAACPTACIAVERDGSEVTVRLSGRLTGAAVPVLRAALLRALPMPCTRLQIDAADVVSLDQDALAVLLAAVPWALASGADFGYRLNRTGPGEPDPSSHYAFHISIGEAY